MKTKKVSLILSILIIMLSAALPVLAFTDDAERILAATDYLETHQNADGSWGGRSAARDTSEIVKVLHGVSPASVSIQPAVDWFSVYEPGNNNYLARKVYVMYTFATAAQSDIDKLLAAMDSDGWGASERLGHDIVSTIVIASALDKLGQLDDTTKEAIVTYIISLQNDDGSFSYYDNRETSIYLTAEVILFLKSMPTYIDVTTVCEDAGGFLLCSQNADGSIGEHLYETLISAKALIKLTSMTAAQKNDLYSYIYAQQASVSGQPEYGSFDNDPYTTALGLSLIDGTAPNLSIRAGSVSLDVTQAQIGDTVTVTMIIDNLGDEDAQDVNVRLYNCASGSSDVFIEETTVELIESRGSAEVSIEFTIESVGVYELCIVVDGIEDIAEQDEGDNLSSFEINMVDGEPPAVSNVSVDFEYISPNGDGVQDESVVTFDLSEDSQVSIEVKPERGLTQKAVSAQAMSQGTNTITWDGRKEGGTLVDDARYTVRIVAVDGSGNTGIGITSIVVDTNRHPRIYKDIDSIVSLEDHNGGPVSGNNFRYPVTVIL
jgi:hypothetical protein